VRDSQTANGGDGVSDATDEIYLALVRRVVAGEPVRTRNADCWRAFGEVVTFDRTPLVGVRKTAWKNALREWEWFMSGSNNIKDLHPSVRHWWSPFCRIDNQTLPHNYGRALRRLYAPETGPTIDVRPKRMEADEPVVVPQFPFRDVAAGKAKHLGYAGANCHGDTFRVVDYVGGSNYVVQFCSNGYCTESKPTNFLRGTVKNPYYPTVNDVGCFGVVNPADYSYYKRAYALWCGLMGRCYNPARRSYRWYGAKGVKVAGRWKCFEYFIRDLSSLPGFEEWLASPGRYDLDKDYLKANYYGPDACIFFDGDRNTALASAERFYDVPRRAVVVDQIQALIDGVRDHPHSRRNVISSWIPQQVAAGLVNPTNCHNSLTQAFVDAADRLHLVTYQRSADVVCGLPANWVQEWAFLLWLARRTGRGVGTLKWVGGDVHVYRTHAAVVEEVLAAGPCEDVPELVYTPTSEEFRADDFALSGEYRPKVLTRAEMVV
jgi:thymidylate synthase